MGLDRKLEELAEGKQIQMQIIDGADHQFRDLYSDDAVDRIIEFLQTINDNNASPE